MRMLSYVKFLPWSFDVMPRWPGVPVSDAVIGMVLCTV